MACGGGDMQCALLMGQHHSPCFVYSSIFNMIHPSFSFSESYFVVLCSSRLLLQVGSSNGKNSSSFLKVDLWVNSLIIIPYVDLGHGALK